MAVPKEAARSAKKLLTVFAGKGAANFLFAGSSVFLLLSAHLFSPYLYLSFLALNYFFRKLKPVHLSELQAQDIYFIFTSRGPPASYGNST